ncbi:hypothetical protein [Rubinisphaera margarita]|uniref:hypothetical protein n=1 Tax=Rubinisphaera margarita TaxID=2909586 RepID=UPI001EE88E35|nr:hypothetical protein [Rubinisphaera margarita]MCG6154173.1 hypothetical protein [Rubinisphaera margarita]
MVLVEDIIQWAREPEAPAERIGSRFSRKDVRARARQYLRGLISRIERENGW